MRTCRAEPALRLSGLVLDSGGGVIPGADVVVKNDATGVATTSVTNGQGAFSFPGLSLGTYTVSVSLQGFKTFVAKNVVLTTGAPANVKAVLDVGGMTEQVTVSSSLNAFNHPNFVPVGTASDDVDACEVTALTGTTTSRTIQLATRTNW